MSPTFKIFGEKIIINVSENMSLFNFRTYDNYRFFFLIKKHYVHVFIENPS